MNNDKVLDLAQRLFTVKRACEKLGRDNYPLVLTTAELEMISDILLVYHQEKANGCL